MHTAAPCEDSYGDWYGQADEETIQTFCHDQQPWDKEFWEPEVEPGCPEGDIDLFRDSPIADNLRRRYPKLRMDAETHPAEQDNDGATGDSSVQ